MDMATSLRSEPETASRAVTTLLGSGPQAPGQAMLLPKVNFKLPDFDPALINTTLALPALIDGLARSGEGRLCLYGPPGTGKTAFAAHVAERLDRDLITVSASSWLHPFLGMTERLMRDSFERAARTDSILFVDEADSFLRDRAAARHSWETTQVNELLKRLEEARGIVLFATNDFDALDPAVLRRLDVKAAFRPLGREQVRTMFERTLAVNDWREPRRELSAALAGLDSLDAVVNGDFTAACRHLHVTGQAMTPAALADALAREVGARERHQGQSIGFAAALE
jgi:SpoVK/Ycf46/Vps4 family AAA+-type ATPase